MSLSDENNKKIIHFLWVTSEQLLLAGEIINSIKCLESLLKFKQDNNDILNINLKKKKSKKTVLKVQLSAIEESITRIKIADLLINYTLNFKEARLHLEQCTLILDESNKESLELLCKISSFLIDIFNGGGANNLTRQWIKSASRYANLLKSSEWKIYFYLKESYLSLKEGNTVTPFQSLDQAIKIADQTSGNLYLRILLNAHKIHFYIIILDYSKIEDLLKETNELMVKFQSQIQSYEVDNHKLPEFYRYILEFPSSNNTIVSRSLEQKQHDISISCKQLSVYYSMIKMLYYIRIGSYKIMEEQLGNLQVNLQEIFDELSLISNGSLPMPLFYFYCGPQYLTCYCYIISAVHSRSYGEVSKALYCLDKALRLIDNQLKYIYQATLGQVTPQQMKESRSLIRLKFIIHENLFYIRLTGMEIERAFSELKYCLEIYSTYPMLFNDGSAECTCHYLSGLYCQALGNHTLSLDHFRLALKKSNRFDTQIHCILRMISAHLSLNEIERATSLMNEYLVQLENHPQLILRSTSLFLHGVILMYHSPDQAKNKFRDSLSLSNNHIGNSQLTSNILNNLARLYLSIYNSKQLELPMEIEKNIQSMLNSSLSLAQLSNDLVGKCISMSISKSDTSELEYQLEKRKSILENLPSDRIDFLQELLNLNIMEKNQSIQSSDEDEDGGNE
ncbi:hypothetical protein DLAC_09527 [Tieghemostelium lacteum]|uniref:Uncharacterized protein n=1 Tax=Tieghemostelium lacteum TaxID=361077 RepID=A0A151Z6I4_TIELA|nr:hypothetical protein DLAC_09527 [Tieghemostelium lacteum]|eukprot:KYQ89573.1 hypothetical protein DLAC_09527 [Tieghemostelium lacteum]